MNNDNENVAIPNTGFCDWCQTEVNIRAINDAHNHLNRECYPIIGKICDSCLDNDFTQCHHCSDAFKTDDMLSYNDDYFCQDCWDKLFSECDYCNNHFLKDELTRYSGEWLCERCYDDAVDGDVYDSIDDYERDYNHTTNKFTKEKICGDVVESTRIFSTEIECYDKSHKLGKVVGNIDEEIGISSDGSLDDGGVEFQTPKLRGKRGEKLIIDLCNELDKNDFSVDSTCGLHIHLDGGRKFITDKIKRNVREPAGLKNLILFYMHFDDVILSFLPPSRRDNRYCVPLSYNYSQSEVINAKSYDDFETLWYKENNPERKKERKGNKYDDTRYSGVNFHSLLANNHLEIRFHSGTINANKILQWVNLHCKIMDYVDGLEVKNITKLTRGNYRSLIEKTIYFFEILKLSNESKEYFLKRQSTFDVKKLSKVGDNAEQNLCVE